MKVSNIISEYSEDYDNLLRWILDNYCNVKLDSHTINFSVKVKKRFLFFNYCGIKEYRVWRLNKNGAYCTPYSFPSRLPSVKPSQEVMNKVLDLELKAKPEEKACDYFNIPS